MSEENALHAAVDRLEVTRHASRSAARTCPLDRTRFSLTECMPTVCALQVTRLRERREEGDALTSADVERIEKADAEKARILALATKMAAGWGVKEEGETSFDPFGRSGGKYG